MLLQHYQGNQMPLIILSHDYKFLYSTLVHRYQKFWCKEIQSYRVPTHTEAVFLNERIVWPVGILNQPLLSGLADFNLQRQFYWL